MFGIKFPFLSKKDLADLLANVDLTRGDIKGVIGAANGCVASDDDVDELLEGIQEVLDREDGVYGGKRHKRRR